MIVVTPSIATDPVTPKLDLSKVEPVTVNVEFNPTELTTSNVDFNNVDPVTSNVEFKPTAPTVFKVPAISVLPLDCCTLKFPTPMFNSVPLNVKFASSSISPLAPAKTILLSVKSVTFNEEIVV